MEMTLNQQIRDTLEEWAELKLQSFSAGLIPGEEHVLGVRLPKLRSYARELAKGNWQTYLREARDDSMEEILPQGMTLGYVEADFDTLEPYLTSFVPKIRNWSVCDSTCATLKIAKKEPERVWQYLKRYLASEEEFFIRFAVVMLLDYYIVEEYIDEVLMIMEGIHHDGYYVKMAVSWNLSVCYVRFPKKTMHFLEVTNLNDWTYNKAIQKMLESCRISREDKEVLCAMKR